MRPQTFFIVILAIVFGLSAAMGVNAFVNKQGGASVKADTVPVLIAAIDVARGGMISSDLVKVRDYPKDMFPSGALSKPEDAIDRAVTIPLVKDEPILDVKLSPKGAGRGLAALVPRGMRAFTIQTPNVASGVAGFVMPGNNVDVLLTVTDQAGLSETLTGGGSTTTLLQKVEILAVDQTIDAPASNKMDTKELRSVTLLVTPHQANLLDLGQNKGILHLALRNLEDNNSAKLQPVTLADLRFRQEKPWDVKLKGLLEAFAKARPAPIPVPPPPAPAVVKAPEPPPPLSIRTIRGTYEGTVLIQNPRVN